MWCCSKWSAPKIIIYYLPALVLINASPSINKSGIWENMRSQTSRIFGYIHDSLLSRGRGSCPWVVVLACWQCRVMSGSMSCLTMVTQGYRVWVNSQGWRHVRFQTRVQDIPLTTSDARVLIEVATGVARSWELKPGIGSWVLRPGNFFGLET